MIDFKLKAETAVIRHLITKVHTTGFISLVADSFDFWGVVGYSLPKLKNVIMSREGKTVIRPDSGDPVKILCGDLHGGTELERKGLVEALWDLFGGTVNALGYKELDSHIGCIYGDAITLERCESICSQLKIKGFASTNVVYGVGSYTYQHNTRDTFGFALKSTLCSINGEEKQIFKNPKTDDGVKKSQKGAVVVLRENGALVFKDNLTLAQANSTPNNLLQTVFRDGKLLVETSLQEIRDRVHAL